MQKGESRRNVVGESQVQKHQRRRKQVFIIRDLSALIKAHQSCREVTPKAGDTVLPMASLFAPVGTADTEAELGGFGELLPSDAESLPQPFTKMCLYIFN